MTEHRAYEVLYHAVSRLRAELPCRPARNNPLVDAVAILALPIPGALEHLGRTVVTVSYGDVRGRARQYPYFAATIYRAWPSHDGRWLWYLAGKRHAYRSTRKAEADARQYAMNIGAEYRSGIRHGMEVR